MPALRGTLLCATGFFLVVSVSGGLFGLTGRHICVYLDYAVNIAPSIYMCLKFVLTPCAVYNNEKSSLRSLDIYIYSTGTFC